jgi:hypothetical protein
MKLIEKLTERLELICGDHYPELVYKVIAYGFAGIVILIALCKIFS